MDNLIIGDVHLGAMSNSHNFLFKTHAPFFRFLTNFVEKHRPKKITFLGDINHRSEHMDSWVSSIGDYYMKKLKSLCDDITIIRGNHDTEIYYDYSFDDDVVKIDSLNGYRNMGIRIIDEPTVIDDTLYLPYLPDVEQEREAINKFDAKYLMCHTSISTFSYEGVDVNPDRHLHPKELSKFKLVISGHIHKHQKKNNIIYPGAPVHTRMVEYANPTKIWMFDTKLVKMVPHEVEGVPRYIRVDYENIKHMSDDEVLEKYGGNRLLVNVPHDMIIDDGRDLIDPKNFAEIRYITRKPKYTKQLDVLGDDVKAESVDIDDMLQHYIENIDVLKGYNGMMEPSKSDRKEILDILLSMKNEVINDINGIL